MGKIFKVLIIGLLLPLLAFGAETKAKRVRTSTTNFGNNLSSVDTNMQKVADTLDDRVTSTIPSNPSDSCSAGTLAYESGFLNVCVATDTWERVVIATWVAAEYYLKIDATHYLLIDATHKLRIQ